MLLLSSPPFSITSCSVGSHFCVLSEISVCILLVTAFARFPRATNCCIVWVAALFQWEINSSFAEIAYSDGFEGKNTIFSFNFSPNLFWRICYLVIIWYFVFLIFGQSIYHKNLVDLRDYTKFYKLLNLNFMALFYGWDSTVSGLQSHYEETFYFLPVSPEEFLVLILWKWMDERLSLLWSHPVIWNLRYPGFGIQHPNH